MDRYVPKRLRVGFKEDQSYIVSYDDSTGKLRSETSFENWRDHDLACYDFNNTTQYYLSVVGWSGGIENSFSYDTRKTYIKIKDVRGYIVEITIDNFLEVLKYSSKGEGNSDLTLDWCYGWDSTQICVVPLKSKEWEEAVRLKDLTHPVTKISQLMPNTWYIKKDGTKVLFLKRFRRYNIYFKHRCPQFGELFRIDCSQVTVGTKECLNLIKKIQTKLPSLKFPELEEFEVEPSGDSDLVNCFYYPGTGEFKFIKSVPSGLFEILDWDPSEETQRIINEAKFLGESRIKISDYEIMPYEEFADSLDKGLTFISKNFFKYPLTVSRSKNDRGYVLVKFPFVNSSGYFMPIRVFFKAEKLEDLYRILAPYKVIVTVDTEKVKDSQLLLSEIKCSRIGVE